MKKTKNILGLGVLLLFCMMPAAAWSVSGSCTGCHTMHNSQGGNPVGVLGASGPYNNLVINGCIGCHTGTNTQGSANLTTSSDAPYVLDTVVPTAVNTLAGGNFYWVADAYGNTDSKGHNVVGISGQDAIGLDPPGWSTNAAFQFNGARAAGVAWVSQLTCDGVNGCHGDVTNGISGSHHNNINGGSMLATTSGNQGQGNHFRFLQGIKGYENVDFEYDAITVPGTTGHNKYKGEIRVTDAVTAHDTMTYFCSSCHGEFHANNGGGGAGLSSGGSMASPWVRHPVDIKLPASAPYTGYADYDVTVPMAYADTTTAPAANDIQASGIITCLTCHVAHGSTYADLLRWDYSSYVVNDGVNTGEGCFKCHADKDAP